MRLALLLALAACTEQKVGVYNTPPGVSILTPADGATLDATGLLEFYGVADDAQDPPESIRIAWTSNVDGELGTDPPDLEGTVYLATTALSPGAHAITLTGVDSNGESDSAAISVTVSAGGSSAGAPTVVMTSPADGASVLAGDIVTFTGVVTDVEQPWDTLSARLISSIDGPFWEGNPDSGGVVTVPYDALSEGAHAVTLQAEDDDGNVSSDAVSFEVLEDGRPTVNITRPTAGDTFSTADTVLLEGEASDDETDTERLNAVWSSSIDGTLDAGAPDSSGYTAAAVHLSEGTHILKLTVYDEDGKEGTDSVAVTVLDPNNVDDDGDGYTENEGDCDDDDNRTSPGATETCDTADNDCDGVVNGDFMDSYEPNDSSATAYDLGELDDDVWAGESVTISGLTLHNEDDIDCFKFFSDDDILDPADIAVSASTFASGGDYLLELTWVDEGRLVDSDSGTGRLYVSYDDSIWDDEEDNWLICIRAVTWDAKACSTSYSLEVVTTLGF